MNPKAYDHSSPESILNYAFPLMGKCLRDFLTLDEQALVVEDIANKGSLGNLVEKYYFHINPGNFSGPDFPEAGVELKTAAVLPYAKVKKNALNPISYRAKERLKLSKINYMKVVDESWSNNALFKKCERILLILSLFEAGVLMLDRKFVARPILWSLSDKDFEYIKNDWHTIVDKIRAGEAHNLSGSDTMYLEACTSGKGTMLEQPFSNEKAKERSFAFKASFVNVSMLDGAEYSTDLQPVITSGFTAQDFEAEVLGRIGKYEGMSVYAIADSLDTKLSTAKHYLSLLCNPMLKIKSRKSEEFIKAGIEIKTINLQMNGTPGEDTSFPAFSYMDIIDEEWEDSVFKQRIDTKMLLMIFRTDENGNVLFVKGCFWSMPIDDFEEARRVWEETKLRVSDGRANNLPSKKFSEVAHVRNHGANSKPENHIPTPLNGNLPVKGFWLNASYMKKQVKYVLNR